MSGLRQRGYSSVFLCHHDGRHVATSPKLAWELDIHVRLVSIGVEVRYYLERPSEAIVWDLRTCWAKGWRVSVSLDDESDVDRVEGIVTYVSPTGAIATIDDMLVPLALVLAIHRPSRLGDSTHDVELEQWRGHPPSWAQVDPNQLTFDV